MTDEQLTALAERFCATPLPASVCADPCASMPDYAFPRSGTNLLTVAEAKEVLRHVLTLPPAMEAATVERVAYEQVRLEVINTPETADFMAGVPLEAAHQRERWPTEHDAGKSPFDWFWLVGYLAQKAADAAVRGDAEKAKHHTISTAAALANWHAALAGIDNRMRPGIAEPLARTSAQPAVEAASEVRS